MRGPKDMDAVGRTTAALLRGWRDIPDDEGTEGSGSPHSACRWERPEVGEASPTMRGRKGAPLAVWHSCRNGCVGMLNR